MKSVITILAGDGIGPEVTNEAVKILKVIEKEFGHSFSLNNALFGGNVVDIIVQLDAWNRCFRVKPENLAGQELTVGVVSDEVEDKGS